MRLKERRTGEIIGVPEIIGRRLVFSVRIEGDEDRSYTVSVPCSRVQRLAGQMVREVRRTGC
jgi:hypothetical protein